MFIIRADGNAKIGAGHLMRCLAIAEETGAYFDSGELLVLCADEDSARLASDRGFQTGVLHTDYRCMEEELPRWKKWITENQNTILVDSYYVTDAYLKALREFGRVCLMDDMQKHAYPVDAVVNYNVFADALVYQKLYEAVRRDEKVRFYLGAEYIPLRRQFKEADYQVQEHMQHVFLTTGGGDADNIAGVVLERIYKPGVVYHVPVGRFSPHLAWWQKKQENCEGIRIYFDVRDMASLMKQCDLAISAGGSTVYELAAVGVPMITFAYAENQELLTEYLGKHAICRSAGNWHLEREKTLERIAEDFEAFCADETLRAVYSQRERKLVDGQGASRLAGALCMEERFI